MNVSFKSTLYTCIFLIVTLLLTDALLAQPTGGKVRTGRTPNLSESLNQNRSCCRDNSGNCIDSQGNACPNVNNCEPCSDTRINPQTPAWGENIGVVNPCTVCPTCTGCIQNMVFKAPSVKNRVPLFVDKTGNTFMDRATIMGNFLPAKANVSSLGSPKIPFKAIYAKKMVGQVSKYSDRRLKTNIESSPYGLQTVMALNPSIYHYKDNVTGTKELGLIAQDLQQTVPEVVSEAGEYLSVDYAALVPVLIQAIQDQQQIIETQKATIEGQTATMQQTQLELKGLKANMAEILDYLQLKELKTSDVND